MPGVWLTTSPGAKYCGKPWHHAYQLDQAEEDIDHLRTKANHLKDQGQSSQTSGVCEHLHQALQDECYSLLFRKKLYQNPKELQRERLHPGRYCYRKTPWETFQATRLLALEKDLSRGGDQSDNTILQFTAVS